MIKKSLLKYPVVAYFKYALLYEQEAHQSDIQYHYLSDIGQKQCIEYFKGREKCNPIRYITE